jgi:hypothetical protein
MNGKGQEWELDNTAIDVANHNIVCDKEINCETEMLATCHQHRLVVPSMESLQLDQRLLKEPWSSTTFV